MYVALAIDLTRPRVETNKKHGAGRSEGHSETVAELCNTVAPCKNGNGPVLANGSGLEFQSGEMREPY